MIDPVHPIIFSGGLVFRSSLRLLPQYTFLDSLITAEDGLKVLEVIGAVNKLRKPGKPMT
ncbi:hypothetical protein CW705_09565 [Candidatus Bathyarchaeota archaeon]|nr:MAG: hypothetical protein CW705_09565 [Candidatus Bathyarchaeota archaeon]